MSVVKKKAYQEKIAGRVREDERIGFFKDNSVATPARVATITSLGGSKQPVIVEEANEFVGKNVDFGDEDTRVESTKINKSAYSTPPMSV